GSTGYAVAGGLAAACIVLGRDQVALLGVYFLAGFVIWRLASAEQPRALLRARALPLAWGALAALLVCALPVLLTVLLAEGSNRPSIDFIVSGRGSLHPP